MQDTIVVNASDSALLVILVLQLELFAVADDGGSAQLVVVSGYSQAVTEGETGGAIVGILV
ncbi:MAG: hypothetical protein ACH254_19005, partial [Candidatus Thiodiazotropha endolucinida]